MKLLLLLLLVASFQAHAAQKSTNVSFTYYVVSADSAAEIPMDSAQVGSGYNVHGEDFSVQGYNQTLESGMSHPLTIKMREMGNYQNLTMSFTLQEQRGSVCFDIHFDMDAKYLQKTSDRQKCIPTAKLTQGHVISSDDFVVGWRKFQGRFIPTAVKHQQKLSLSKN